MPGLAKSIKFLFLLVLIYLAAAFIVAYVNLPLPTTIGVDWGEHFSPVLYVADLVIWGTILYFLYLYIRPLFKNKKSKLILWCVVLALSLTFISVFFHSPLYKQWDTGRMLYLKHYVVPNHGAQSKAGSGGGFPYNFYAHDVGLGTGGDILWDNIYILPDDLWFDLFFWVIVSMIILRLFKTASFLK